MKGLKQVRMKGGAVVSILDAADYRLNADGSIDLYAGSVTVAGGDGSTVVRMPDGVEGRVTGRASAASFSVGTDGKGRGNVQSGQVQVGRGRSEERRGGKECVRKGRYRWSPVHQQKQT